MSVPVELAALEAQLAHYGAVAFLVTVAPDARPHVVSVRVLLADGVLTMPAGRTSRANVATAPQVTLCWPGPTGAEHCLLVDGTARADDEGETVTVTPTSAILHRLADAPTDVPYCVPLDAPREPPA